MDSDFVHLHVHSEYSLLDSINKVEDLPKIAKEKGMSSLAITDHGSVGGNYKFFKECKKNEVKPILGMEGYWSPGERGGKEVDELGKLHYHLLLLALNNQGVKNLNKLSSMAHTENFYHKPRLDNDMLSEHSEGLCASTACLGSKPSQLILNGKPKEAKRLIEEWSEIFSGRMLIELEIGLYTKKGRDELTLIEGNWYGTEQMVVNKELVRIANELDLPLIVTNDVHYGLREHQDLHDMALCIQTNSPRNAEKRFSFRGLDCHLGSPAFMKKHCRILGLPEEAISNTVAVSEMVDADSYFEDRKNRQPTFLDLPEEETAWSWLEIQAQHGLYERFGEMPPKEYRDRLAYELKELKKMGFSDYMLIVEQVLDIARGLNCPVGPGRGSSAGSLVAWATRITQIDPIKHGLFFERLNKAPVCSDVYSKLT